MPPHLCQGANILFLPIPPAPSAPRRASCSASQRSLQGSHPAPGSLCRATRPAPGVPCRASRPATRRPLLKKGSIRKLFWRANNISLTERHRIWNAGTVDFREPIYGHRAPSPLWCFVLSCMVGGILRKPLGFRRCLPPARPEKAWPFQAGRSPCTKHPRLSSFAFTPRKKFLRVPRGVFSKTRPWQGVGQGPTKRRASQLNGVRLFRRDGNVKICAVEKSPKYDRQR